MTSAVTTADGLRLAVARWPGDDSVLLLLSHATGFCKEVWGPVVEEIRAAGLDWTAVAWDSRGHGSSEVPEPPIDWWGFAEDVRAVARAHGNDRRLVGMGHSCGGAALAMADILQPGTFSALVLVEPIVFPPPYRRRPDAPLARRAERRRQSFSSREAARRHLVGKALFEAWDPRAVEGYLRGGFEEREDGYRLRCPPTVEADIYRGATAHGAWERLEEVEVPVLVMAGERSDSHARPFAEELAGRFPEGRLEVVEGTGHFLPMERPALLAERAAAFFRTEVQAPG